MDSLIYDIEVTEGLSHFRCDVCDIAYNYDQVGFAWQEYMNHGGRYTNRLLYACKTCLEELGYE